MVLIMMVQAAPPDLSLPRITPRADCSMSRDEVVVCGRRGASDRYRIPPSVRSMDTEADGAGNGLSGTQVLGGVGPCGMFADQRRCSHSEAREAGYGGGRDPLTFGAKILKRLTDPEAEIDPPAMPPAEPKQPGR
ncbi:hypothetical protein [Sphingomonas yabuuchiae]|uniref:Uncharacterized protein n=1 Tax=Sphingomonas yabuuchiae TaxID=172044 RepID=A0AA40ZY59_9SPHN|nr:hypothetical protein [Sphingomonas yabuuchiae]MBB4610422.1 hypothetical protein [Sphingomonas yabuuchiae]MBN3558169.1 hypothetical protein [Sphingomonas yabuuchiae]